MIINTNLIIKENKPINNNNLIYWDNTNQVIKFIKWGERNEVPTGTIVFDLTETNGNCAYGIRRALLGCDWFSPNSETIKHKIPNELKAAILLLRG